MVHHDEVVRVQRQEVVELRRRALPAEDPPGLRVPPLPEPLGPHLGLDPSHLLLHDAREQLRRGAHLDAGGVERRAVAQPLPVLDAADLRGGRVLHQVVERHGAGAGQPRREVLHAHAGVEPQAVHRARAPRQLDEVLRCSSGRPIVRFAPRRRPLDADRKK